MSLKKGSASIIASTLALCSIFFSVLSVGNPSLYAADEEQGASVQAAAAQDAPAGQEYSLDDYLQAHKDAASPARTLTIRGTGYASYEGGTPEVLSNIGDDPAEALLTSDSATVTWQFDVPETGNYFLRVRYYPYEGKNAVMERELRIDGEIPFWEAKSIEFQRVWKDSAGIQTDDYGNEYRPEQQEVKKWLVQPVQAKLGYYAQPTPFFLTAGTHALTLVSVNEPMLIDTLEWYNEDAPLSYEDIYDQWVREGKADSLATAPIVIQAENASSKSDPTLFPINDRTSPITEPQDISRIKMNTIGGINWRYPGQWIEWEFNVEDPGFYLLSMRTKQDYVAGTSSYRKILIDGALPFREFSDVKFEYGFNWTMTDIGGEGAYRIYFSKGKHSIRIVNTIGEISSILSELENTVYELNYIYRKIMMITGSFPDPNQDYRIEQRLPESVEIFSRQSAILYDLADRLYQITGSKGTDYGRLIKLAYQLQTFVDNPQNIPERLDTFRQNISDQSAWLLSASEQPLLIDYLEFRPADVPAGRGDAAWYGKLLFELKTFFVSFVADYSNIGSAGKEGEEVRRITLWMGAIAGTIGGSGRDQAQIVKSMIDNYFTPKTGIQVNLKLIDMSILLPAVAAGMGPDVALSQSGDTPVNYALRNAIYDLSNFSDLDTVLQRFDPAAYESFKIGDSVYALPETENFHMMFYRTDILKEIQAEVPETWNDIYNIIPVLHRHYMDIALPQIDTNDMSVLQMMIYQAGSEYYNKERTRAIFDSPASADAFIEWSELYTKYKVAVKADALTRFRTGESPIVIQPYTFYNALAIAAPEINGLWDFTLVPGTIRPDGSVSHATVASSTGTVIFSNAKDKPSAWEFLKWWTDTDAQVSYGREIESLQGTSARWPTANLDAFDQLPWPSKAAKTLKLQRSQVVGLPELPGSYITARYLGNAIKDVVNNGANPRETILNWNKKINDEIISKRKEFGME